MNTTNKLLTLVALGLVGMWFATTGATGKPTLSQLYDTVGTFFRVQKVGSVAANLQNMGTEAAKLTDQVASAGSGALSDIANALKDTGATIKETTQSIGAKMDNVATPTPVVKATNPIGEGQYTVVAGDTLWDIAVRKYGTGFKYQDIAKANPSIKNVNLIYPGQVLNLP